MPLLRTVGRTAVIAGTASAVGGRVQHRQNEKWAAQEQQQYAQQAPPPPAAEEQPRRPAFEPKPAAGLAWEGGSQSRTDAS